MATIKARIEIDPVTILLESALHAGAGYRRGMIDKAVMRDGRGQVYLPGSSLKGKVREACEWIATSQGLACCLPPDPKGVCGHCIVCRIFGAPGGWQDETTSLYWDNAYLTSEWQKAAGNKKENKDKDQLKLSYSRTHVGISRSRGVAHEGLLFSGEFSAEGLSLQTRLNGCLSLTPILEEQGRYYELILLVAGLKLVDEVGGNTSRGAGRCHITLPQQMGIQSPDYGEEKLEIDWLIDRLELLSLYKEEVEEAR